MKSPFLFHFVYACQTLLSVLLKCSLSLQRRCFARKVLPRFHLLLIHFLKVLFDCLHSFWIPLNLFVTCFNLMQFIPALWGSSRLYTGPIPVIYHLNYKLLSYASDLLKLALRFLEHGSQKVPEDKSQKRYCEVLFSFHMKLVTLCSWHIYICFV